MEMFGHFAKNTKSKAKWSKMANLGADLHTSQEVSFQ